MANVQHIYKGAGEPQEVLADFHEVEGHHYLDTLTANVYIGNSDGVWIKINDPVRIGLFTRLEVQSAPMAPQPAVPEGPMLWIDQRNGDAYLATATGGPPSPTWEWRKISFI